MAYLLVFFKSLVQICLIPFKLVQFEVYEKCGNEG
jgi:hypothetical protein